MNAIVKGSKPGLTTPSFSPNSSPLLEKVYVPQSKNLSEEYDSSNSNLYNVLPDQHENSEVGATVPSISRCVTNASDRGYPEGGLRAWLVVFGSFCGMAGSFGFMNTIGVFQAYLSAHQLRDYNESTIGWIFSVYVFLAFFGGLQIGPVFDAKGPRLLILSGSILMVAAVLLMGICTQYWHFMLTIGILAGTGTSLIFTPAVSSVGHFFLVKRASATGLAATGGAIGGIAFPLMFQRLFPRIGWAWSTRVLALIFLVLCTFSVLLVRSRLPPKPGSSVLPDLRIYRQPAFAFTSVGVFFMEWGLFVPITYIVSYVASTGIAAPGSSFPFAVLVILNAGSCLGRYLPGIFADQIGRFNAMIIALVLCASTSLSIWLPATVIHSNSSAIKSLVIIYAAVFGFASGSNISLTPVCVGQLCRTSEYGRYYATCYTLVAFGTLTGIPLAGALLQVCNGGFMGVALFTGGCYVMGTASLVIARWYKVGFSLVQY